MRGRLAATAAICAVLVTGCASTVGGVGLRGSTSAAAGSGAASGSASSPDSAAQGSASTSGSDQSDSGQQGSSPSGEQGTPSSQAPIRPIPPVVTTSQDDQQGSSSAPGGQGSGSAPVSSPPTGDSPAIGGSDPAQEFDGASPVDASSYPGLVTDIGFQSPSGNIACGIQDGTVTCQIDDFSYQPQPSGDCHGGGFWGNAIRLTSGDAATFRCAGDVESGGPTLAYGSQIIAGQIRCVSRQDGVTCQNTDSGYGFRVARAAYVFFGPDDDTATVGASGAGDSAAIPSALVGEWGGHGRSVTITAAGTGTLGYRAYRWCSDDPTPPCDKKKGNQIFSGGHLEFTLTASSGAKVATGSVTKSNDPKTPVGEKITVTASDAYHVSLSIWPGTPFCSMDTPSDKWDCGA